jgi:hypothetical protein
MPAPLLVGVCTLSCFHYGLPLTILFMAASPRKNRLPSEYTSSSNMFCQNCKTNQTLLINLRASFLPEPFDPQYQQRLAQWPAYEQSLLARYPPVCMNCEDNVSKEIARKDSLARTSALGGFLKHTKGKELARAVTKGKKARLGQDKSLLAWRIRGFLWITTTVMAISTFGICESPSDLSLHESALTYVQWHPDEDPTFFRFSPTRQHP